MKSYIEFIKQIIHKGGTLTDCENRLSSFVMNKPATEEEINKCDVYSKNRLPNEYQYFLRYFNGGILFEYDDIVGFKFLGSNEFIQENEFRKEGFGEYWDNNVILFCYLVGIGECIGFRFKVTKDYEIVHCFMDVLPNEWLVIGNSFDEFIENLIQEKGKEYWLFQENK
jgi:hypothetical protein